VRLNGANDDQASPGVEPATNADDGAAVSQGQEEAIDHSSGCVPSLDEEPPHAPSTSWPRTAENVLSRIVNVERLKALLAAYGRIALAAYLTLFVLVFAGFALAISAGVNVASAQGGAGVLGAAYVATKLTQPLRIAATVALTPLLARLVEKFRTHSGERPEGLSANDMPPPREP
jgi:hypothetical protein